MRLDFGNEKLNACMLDGEYGLEVESQRVNEQGQLAQTPNPEWKDPRIDLDFCESQIELITGVHTRIEDLLKELHELQAKVAKKLWHREGGREFLWHCSNPPWIAGEASIPIAQFPDEKKEKETYRNYLAEKYGRHIMLYSGIHMNYSFPKTFLEAAKEAAIDFDATRGQFHNQLYLQLAGQVLAYDWLIVYLIAASPLMDASFYEEGSKPRTIPPRFGSHRLSEEGYWNYFDPILEYGDIESYVDSFGRLIRDGKIRSASELYYPIRPKNRGVFSLKRLLELGINHIEFRMIDINPFLTEGIAKEDVLFLQLLSLYLLAQNPEPVTAKDQVAYIARAKNAASYDETEVFIDGVPIRRAAFAVLEDMEQFFLENGKREVVPVISYQKEKLTRENGRYCERLVHEFGDAYLASGIQLSGERARKLMEEG